MHKSGPKIQRPLREVLFISQKLETPQSALANSRINRARYVVLVFLKLPK